MAKEQENTMNYSIQDDRVIGEVQIADEVVAIIAGLAATEVKGVASMYGNITNELVAKLGMKNLSKGVKIEVSDSKVSVDLAINLEYGYNIPEVTGAVQDRVKNAIETMTGLSVEDVNIRVAGVNLEDE
ncbi:Asp23/Gls24 family envelope stress response protein [Frisingicoccus sp.]|uniref:Asp23/Gls24 family envelope stress response protein n=1 Tax=Frisingicoccus sp. TaxID=1918627 RepID=UPI003AB55441